MFVPGRRRGGRAEVGGRGVGSIYLSSFCLPGFLVGEGEGLTEGACSCVRRDMAGYDTF